MAGRALSLERLNDRDPQILPATPYPWTKGKAFLFLEVRLTAVGCTPAARSGVRGGGVRVAGGCGAVCGTHSSARALYL